MIELLAASLFDSVAIVLCSLNDIAEVNGFPPEIMQNSCH